MDNLDVFVQIDVVPNSSPILFMVTIANKKFPRRFSHFLSLANALPKPLPALFPPQDPLLSSSSAPLAHSLFPARINARRDALQTFLKTILSSPDPRWRSSQAFQTFLTLSYAPSLSSASQDSLALEFPAQERPKSIADVNSKLDGDSWIENFQKTSNILTAIKSDLLAKQSQSDIATIHGINSNIRKAISSANAQISSLSSSLAASKLPPGELQRRSDLLDNLKEDLARISKASLSTFSNPTHSRNALLSSSSGSSINATSIASSQTTTSQTANNASNPSNPPNQFNNSQTANPLRSTRKFGNAPVETDQTRPLDNRGLLSLQSATLSQQESELDSLAQIIRRQRELATTMNMELENQNHMLADLDAAVDRTTSNLNTSDKKLGRLLKK